MRRVRMIGIALLAVSLACGQPSRPALGPVATVPTEENAPHVSLAPASTPAGPYATLDAAETHVTSEIPPGQLQLLRPDVTWRSSAILHVIHATHPSGASYAGDFYFFFVDGDQVGVQYFTSASTSVGVDDTTYSITYWVFEPNDPHCCPSGGQATVRFRWDGKALGALDPTPGQTQS